MQINEIRTETEGGRKKTYPCFRVARGRSDCVDNILTELIFETVDNSDPSESISSPGVSDGSTNRIDFFYTH